MAAARRGRSLPELEGVSNEVEEDGAGSTAALHTGSKRRARSKSRSDSNQDINNSNNNQSTGTVKKTRRKKKKQPPVQQQQHPAVVGASSVPSLHSGQSATESAHGELSQSNATLNGSKPRKKRRRKTATRPASGKIESLGVDIADIQDDIIDEATDPESDSAAQAPHRSHMKSQPIGKLFIEQTRGFRSIHSNYSTPRVSHDHQPPPVDILMQHLHLIGGFKSADKKVIDDLYSDEQKNKDRKEDEEASYPVKLSSMAFALTTIQVIKTFAHFCMGILAGLAVWQTLYAYTLTNLADTGPFLEMYQFLSIPINCVFYVIIVFCTVATFDRYDVSKVTRPCLLKACTLQSGAVAALLYTTALCINVSMASMDDRLGPKTNGTTDSLRDFPSKDDEKNLLTIWKSLSLVRAVLVGLAWFVISLRPGTDRLTKNLSQSEVTWGDKDEMSHRLP